MKLLFDFFPVLLFFIVFKIYGIYSATAVAIIASSLQVLFVWIKFKRVEKTYWITFILILFLGGATLFFHNEMFIKWKPTAINWLFALVFLGSHFIGKKPIVQRMMEKNVKIPDPIWKRLSYAWVFFFLFMGLINIYVVYNYDTNTWVNFKLFGILGLTIVFVLLQAFYLAKHIDQTPDQSISHS